MSFPFSVHKVLKIQSFFVHLPLSPFSPAFFLFRESLILVIDPDLRKKAQILFSASMAEVLAKKSFVLPCEHRSSALSPAIRRSFSVACPPGGGAAASKFEVLTSSSNAYEKRLRVSAVSTPMTLTFGKALKWWEKNLQPNMKEVESAQDLVDSLKNSGDKLVIVDFFSPGCAGCRALHQKICQIAEQNPDVQFLQVNYEKHKSMCHSLHVHVLPFFRFYRGAQGRLCSFSCTNATIKKFKDALAKSNTDRCSLGPPEGLEEKELLALAANKDLSFEYPLKPVPIVTAVDTSELVESASASPPVPFTMPAVSKEREDKALTAAGR